MVAHLGQMVAMSSMIEPFHAIAISGLAHQLKSEGRSVIHMEFGQPSTGAPRAAIEAAHKILDSDPMGYWESPALKTRIAQHYKETYGVEVAPGQLILTCGASPALVLALSSCFSPGDQIALARPGYVAYRNTLRALHMVPVELECGPEERFQLSAARLAALDPVPAGVILASPANPTGTIIPAGELEAIAQVCRERGIKIISDEIYHGLSYVEPARSILEFEPNALVVNSFSKYFSMTGWRIGWLTAPQQLIPEISKLIEFSNTCTPGFVQAAAQYAVAHGEPIIAETVARLRTSRDHLAQLLSELPGIRLGPPARGAMYSFFAVDGVTDSLAFCRDLIDKVGLGLAPGIAFGEEGEGFVRWCFASDPARIDDGVSRLADYLARCHSPQH